MTGYPYITAVFAPDTSSSGGFQGTSFTGVFDGNGHTLSNLTIDTVGANNDFLGLFGRIEDPNAGVKGLGLENVNITGGEDSDYLGGLCGWNDYGSIRNCHATGPVNGGDDSWSLGGVVGHNNYGSISNCYAIDEITGGSRIGGLCGWNEYGSISNCYTTGLVTGGWSSWYLGGLCGWNEGYISVCYSTGSVSGASYSYYLGGLCGNNYGSISNCYATGSVTGGEHSGFLGGLCGENNEGSISNCYATGSVNGGEHSGRLGGLCGHNRFVIISNCFWDVETSGLTVSDGGFGRTAGQMQTASTFVGWGDGNWTIATGDYPRLTWENTGGTPLENIPSRTYAGSGTPADPFILASAADLLCLAARQEDWASCCALAGDIDMIGVSAYLPIGDFTGELNGRGHRILNLTVNEPGSSQLGLIGHLGDGAKILYLGMENFNITGYLVLSGLCGYNSNGSISNCYTRGSVNGGDDSLYLGGLCGINDKGSISDCYATGSVTGGYYLGGLCGVNNKDSMSNCYATCSVTGLSSLGGLCGENYHGSISNCYATGTVTGGDNSIDLGGLVGYDYIGSYSANFWNRDINPTLTGLGNIGDPPEIRGRTMAQMQVQSTFTDYSWDFVGDNNGTENHWQLCLDGYDYPRLTWQFVNPADFLLPGRVDHYDLFVLTHDWLTENSRCCDIIPSPDGDGIVNIFDYQKFSEYWLIESLP